MSRMPGPGIVACGVAGTTGTGCAPAAEERNRAAGSQSALRRNNMVEKNRAGACCEYQSAAIAKAVGGILSLSDEDYGRMGRRASALIDNQYNWEAVEPRLLGLIKSLASR